MVRLWVCRLVSVAAALVAIASCGGGQTRGHPLDSSWDDQDGSELASFQKHFRIEARPRLVPLAIGVVNDDTLIGKVLTTGQRWRFEHPLESRPIIAGSVVVGMGDRRLFALDAETGEELWERPAVGYLRGASDDGATTLISIESLSGRRSTVLAIERNGAPRRQIYLQAAIGRPLVADAYAFLPYNRTMVLVFDLLEGTEVARVVADYPVSHAFRVGDDIYFGEDDAVRFDASIVDARRGGGDRVAVPANSYPLRPQWHLPGSMPYPVAATRDDTVRFLARPVVVEGEAALDRYALSFYSLVVGLEAPGGSTRWVHRGRAAKLGGWAGHRTFAFCDAGGGVVWLDARTGAVVDRDDLGEAVVACAVQSEDPTSPRDATAASLTQQLADAIADPRPELAPLQQDLLAELDAIEGDEVAMTLTKLASVDSEATPRIAETARERLAKRRTGFAGLSQLMIDDHQRPSWSPSTLPIAALAEALGRSRQEPVRMILAERLNDPTLGPKQTVAVAEAVERLTRELDTAANPRIRRLLVGFLAAHACPEPSYDAATLAVAKTLLELGATGAVTQAARGPCDRAAMKASLQAAIRGHRPDGRAPGTPNP